MERDASAGEACLGEEESDKMRHIDGMHAHSGFTPGGGPGGRGGGPSGMGISSESLELLDSSCPGGGPSGSITSSSSSTCAENIRAGS